jgi:hypothetical protein
MKNKKELCVRGMETTVISTIYSQTNREDAGLRNLAAAIDELLALGSVRDSGFSQEAILDLRNLSAMLAAAWIL